MRKSTKNKLFVFFVIITFGMSSIAFVTTSFFTPPQEEIKPLESFVIEGEVNPLVEERYLQSGFTWMKFYYSEADPMLVAYIDSLPEQYADGSQPQMVVQKLQANSTYITIKGQNGEKEINATEAEVFSALCELLYVTPPECGLSKLLQGNTTNINGTI